MTNRAWERRPDHCHRARVGARIKVTAPEKGARIEDLGVFDP